MNNWKEDTQKLKEQLQQKEDIINKAKEKLNKWLKEVDKEVE